MSIEFTRSKSAIVLGLGRVRGDGADWSRGGYWFAEDMVRVSRFGESGSGNGNGRARSRKRKGSQGGDLLDR
jgi:hypothetical protein